MKEVTEMEVKKREEKKREDGRRRREGDVEVKGQSTDRPTDPPHPFRPPLSPTLSSSRDVGKRRPFSKRGKRTEDTSVFMCVCVCVLWKKERVWCLR
jgi:hypothetical protein